MGQFDSDLKGGHSRTVQAFMRYVAAAINAPSDGDFIPFLSDTGGNLKVVSFTNRATRPGSARKNYSGTVTAAAGSNTTQALETVPALKTFYITDVMVYTLANNANNVTLRVSGVDIFQAPCQLGDPTIALNIANGPTVSAGQTLNIYVPLNAATPVIIYNVFGEEF